MPQVRAARPPVLQGRARHLVAWHEGFHQVLARCPPDHLLFARAARAQTALGATSRPRSSARSPAARTDAQTDAQTDARIDPTDARIDPCTALIKLKRRNNVWISISCVDGPLPCPPIHPPQIDAMEIIWISILSRVNAREDGQGGQSSEGGQNSVP